MTIETITVLAVIAVFGGAFGALVVIRWRYYREARKRRLELWDARGAELREERYLHRQTQYKLAAAEGKIAQLTRLLFDREHPS